MAFNFLTNFSSYLLYFSAVFHSLGSLSTFYFNLQGSVFLSVDFTLPRSKSVFLGKGEPYFYYVWAALYLTALFSHLRIFHALWSLSKVVFYEKNFFPVLVNITLLFGSSGIQSTWFLERLGSLRSEMVFLWVTQIEKCWTGTINVEHSFLQKKFNNEF